MEKIWLSLGLKHKHIWNFTFILQNIENVEVNREKRKEKKQIGYNKKKENKKRKRKKEEKKRKAKNYILQINKGIA